MIRIRRDLMLVLRRVVICRFLMIRLIVRIMVVRLFRLVLRLRVLVLIGIVLLLRVLRRMVLMVGVRMRFGIRRCRRRRLVLCRRRRRCIRLILMILSVVLIRRKWVFVVRLLVVGIDFEV